MPDTNIATPPINTTPITTVAQATAAGAENVKAGKISSTGIPIPPPAAPTASTVPPQGGTSTTSTSSPTGMNDQSFLGVLNNLNNGFQQGNSLVDQKNALIKHMFDTPLTPEETAKLPPEIQSVIASGDRNQIALQLQVINDSLQGRNQSIASSIQYLTTGYTAAEQRKTQAETTLLNYAQQLGQTPYNVAKAMFPELLAGMNPDQLKALQALPSPYAKTTQIVPDTSGTGGSYDLSSYATDPNYTSTVQGIQSNIGTITSSTDAQKYIDTNFGSSPITGAMIMNAASEYGVDPSLMMAQIQQESQFGTSSVATKDNNAAGITWSQAYQDSHPGTSKGSERPEGGNYVKFDTLQNSINANAEWLSQHKTGASVSPEVQAYVDGISSGSITSLAQVPAQYKTKVALALDNQNSTSPLAERRQVMVATGITEPYTNLPGYSLVANGLPYLGRIDAALKTQGSVSDQDLLDSLTKLNTAGNSITDAQVSIITGGKSFKDSLGVWSNKLTTGGVLSDDQRKQIKTIADAIYANYAKEYQPIYDAATKKLKDSKIPENLWTIPDLNSLAKDSGLTIPGVGDLNKPTSVNLKDPKTGEVRSFSLSADDLKSALSQGYIQQ